jgi:hypothetical protein
MTEEASLPPPPPPTPPTLPPPPVLTPPPPPPPPTTLVLRFLFANEAARVELEVPDTTTVPDLKTLLLTAWPDGLQRTTKRARPRGAPSPRRHRGRTPSAHCPSPAPAAPSQRPWQASYSCWRSASFAPIALH